MDRFDRPQGGELTRVSARRDDPGLLAWKLLTHRRWFTGVDLPLVPPDLFNGFQQQLISPDVFKGFQQQTFPEDFVKGFQRPVTQPDRTDDVRMPDNAKEQSTSQDSRSRDLAETDESDEPTDA
ncbi:MAG TPA: hypothetical protein VGC06_30490 [Actinomycetes bacterium]